MRESNKEILQKAKNYAFLLLKYRLRSEKELYRRLKNKKFAEEIINRTLSFLKDKKFIDDGIFAQAWIESRIKRGLGLSRIKNELRLKGIDTQIIDTQISEIKKDYPERDLVANIAEARLSKLKGIEPVNAKRRLYAYLLRRGFSPETVIDVLTQLCKQTP